jgi:RNA 3'-terminal phosphate cyclase (ATP)
MDPITIDGSEGEGGGQVLRSALSLAAVTGRAVVLERIRARRERGGLLAQHLCALRAAATLTEADVQGDTLRSTRVVFRPRAPRAGVHRFEVGTAGSACLVVQTILPILLAADGPSTVYVSGGTHNPKAPTFEYLDEVYLPLLRRMGAAVQLHLDRAGFYPRGGGRLRLEVRPGPLTPIELREIVRPREVSAVAVLAGLPQPIADRELGEAQRKLGLLDADLATRRLESDSPGNVFFLRHRVGTGIGPVVDLSVAFGEQGVAAERVAREALRRHGRLVKAEVAVGEHLADQLLLPLALAGGGAFRTVAPLSLHARTHVAVLRRFLPRDVHVRDEGPRVLVEVA